MVKKPPTNAAYAGLIPGIERSPGGENDNSLQYPCLQNPMDRGDCWATAKRSPKSQAQLSNYYGSQEIKYGREGNKGQTSFSSVFW